jgi:hypothetical protein
LQHQTYLDWRASSAPMILWLHGIRMFDPHTSLRGWLVCARAANPENVSGSRRGQDEGCVSGRRRH